MLNLLPKKAKKRIRKEYLLRLIVIFLFMSAWLVFFAGILLVPSFLVSSVKENVATERLDVLAEFNNLILDEDLQNESKILNTRIEVLISDKSLALAENGFLEIVVRSKPDGIYIDNISYDWGNGRAILRGSSINREILLSFIKILESRKEFFDIDLPISNLVKDRNIPFTIKISLNDE